MSMIDNILYDPFFSARVARYSLFLPHTVGHVGVIGVIIIWLSRLRIFESFCERS